MVFVRASREAKLASRLSLTIKQAPYPRMVSAKEQTAKTVNGFAD